MNVSVQSCYGLFATLVTQEQGKNTLFLIDLKGSEPFKLSTTHQHRSACVDVFITLGFGFQYHKVSDEAINIYINLIKVSCKEMIGIYKNQQMV